jgi:hypothetical protein
MKLSFQKLYTIRYYNHLLDIFSKNEAHITQVSFYYTYLDYGLIYPSV